VQNLTGKTGTDVARVPNRAPAAAANKTGLGRPTRWTPAARAFPYVGPLYAEATPIERRPVDRLVVIEKRVMDSQLKNVLIALATIILLAFTVGLVLWVMS
jgi:hypothetical protein